MSDIDKDLHDALLHYGVKGMRWGNRRSDLDYKESSEDSGSGGGSSEEDDLKKIEDDLGKLSKQLEEIRSKVGDGPLDMLKNVLFGTTKKSPKKEKTLKVDTSDPSDTLKKLRESLKDVKSKVGDGHLDMLKYALTGKRKVQHSTLKDHDLILHYGVQGMRWGVRRNTKASRKRYRSYNKGMKLLDRVRLKKITSSTARQKYLDDKDSKWLAKVGSDKNIQKVAKTTAKEMKKANKELKKEFGGTGLRGEAKRALNGNLNADFHKAMRDAYNEILADSTFSVYKLSPSRTREVEVQALSDGTFKATIVERNNPKLNKQRASITKAVENRLKKEGSIKHAAFDDEDDDDDATNLHGMSFIILPDEDGFPDEIVEPFDSDEHDIKHSDSDDILTLKDIDDECKVLGRDIAEDLFKELYH
jgi:hypothetical protein